MPKRTAPDLLLALGHAERFALLQRLRVGPAKQKELVSALEADVGIKQPAASKHLRELTAIGLVTKAGRLAPYELVESTKLGELLDDSEKLAKLL